MIVAVSRREQLAGYSEMKPYSSFFVYLLLFLLIIERFYYHHINSQRFQSQCILSIPIILLYSVDFDKKLHANS